MFKLFLKNKGRINKGRINKGRINKGRINKKIIMFLFILYQCDFVFLKDFIIIITTT